MHRFREKEGPGPLPVPCTDQYSSSMLGRCGCLSSHRSRYMTQYKWLSSADKKKKARRNCRMTSSSSSSGELRDLPARILPPIASTQQESYSLEKGIRGIVASFITRACNTCNTYSTHAKCHSMCPRYYAHTLHTQYTTYSTWLASWNAVRGWGLRLERNCGCQMSSQNRASLPFDPQRAAGTRRRAFGGRCSGFSARQDGFLLFRLVWQRQTKAERSLVWSGLVWSSSHTETMRRCSSADFVRPGIACHLLACEPLISRYQTRQTRAHRGIEQVPALSRCRGL